MSAKICLEEIKIKKTEHVDVLADITYAQTNPHVSKQSQYFPCCLSHTANEGPVRIQYKCLVRIYVFPEMKLLCLVISKTELQCSVTQFPYSCIYEQFIYYQDRSAYFAANMYINDILSVATMHGNCF